MSNNKILRRSFIKSTAAAFAAPAFLQCVHGAESPNEQLNVAVLGVRSRGLNNVEGFDGKHGCKVTTICDVDEKIGQNAARGGKKFVRDSREVFDDKNIDLVAIATPNHWHALGAVWAMQAGKDVYVEKPVSHNIDESRRCVQAARKYNRICQVGTQNRSHKSNQEAIAFLKEGGIGECNLGRSICYKPRKSIGGLGRYEAPKSVDYDLWQGPATLRPITRPQFHYDWHWQYHWGNGDMGNQAAHQTDIVRWGLGVDTLPEQIISYGGRLGYIDAGDVANTQVGIHLFDGGKKTIVTEIRGLPSQSYRGAGWFGLCFHGDKGYIVMNSYTKGAAYDKDGKKIKTFSGSGDHYGNFVAAVRKRDHTILNADILVGHYSAALAHTATIAYRIGKPSSVEEIKTELTKHKSLDNNVETLDRMVAHLKKNGVDLDKTPLQLGPVLTMDQKTEKFTNNDRANGWLSRTYRAPFVLPSEKDV